MVKAKSARGMCHSLIQTLIKRQATCSSMSIRHDRPDGWMGYCWCGTELWTRILNQSDAQVASENHMALAVSELASYQPQAALSLAS